MTEAIINIKHKSLIYFTFIIWLIVFAFEIQSNFNSITKEIKYSLINVDHSLEDKNSRYTDFLNYSGVFFEKHHHNNYRESLYKNYTFDSSQKIFILNLNNSQDGIITSEKNLHRTDEEFIISKATSLTNMFKEAKLVFSKSPWIYFTSPHFIYIYPYTSPTNFKFSKELVNLDYFQKSLPQNNPHRKIIWSNPYFDLAGQGMMITKSKPIYLNNKFVGTIAIDIKTEDLNEGINFKNFELGKFFILNPDKTIISSSNVDRAPNKNKITKYPINESLNNLSDINFKNCHFIFYKHLVNNDFHLIYEVSCFKFIFHLLSKQTFSLIIFLILSLAYLRLYFKEKLHLQKEADNIYKNKLISLAEMSGGIAHEINNPLTIIKGKASQSIKKINRNEISTDELKNAFEKIIFSSDRIANIITALKNFSNNETELEMSPQSLTEIINDTLLLCENKIHNGDASLEIELIPNINIKCHKHQIIQLLFNLINNAFDAVSDLPDKWIKISFVIENQYLKINILDSGFGIAEGIQSKIFEPFYTTKPLNYGTGLGLSISKKIAINHSGDLIINKKMANTCFVVILPFFET